MINIGAHLKFKGAYGYPSLYHHGVYAGNGQVVHFYAHNGKNKASAEIQAIPLQDFIKLAHPYAIEQVRSRLPPEIIRQRCFAKIGAKNYHMLLNNCEHFANWATTGEHRSYQVEAILHR